MSACALSDSSIPPTAGETTILKIKKMIADNYAMIGMYLLFVVALGFILWYFLKSFTQHVKSFYDNKQEQVKPKISVMSNSSLTKDADDVNYDPDIEPPPDDPKDYMEPAKKSFVKEVDRVYKDYNQALDDYIHTTLGKVENDTKIDAGVLFKPHDNYNYSEE